MNEEKTVSENAEFDEIDARLVAALAEEPSEWPTPRAGFEERCAARVAELLKERDERRGSWIPAVRLVTRIAAALAVGLGVVWYVASRTPAANLAEGGGEPRAHVAANDEDAAADGVDYEDCTLVVVGEEVSLEDARRELLSGILAGLIPSSSRGRALRSICVGCARCGA